MLTFLVLLGQQLKARMVAVKHDSNASIKIFRSLLPTLPRLRPLLHKVVTSAAMDSAVGESEVPFGTPLFEAFPPAVLFVGYESAEVYQAHFRLRLAWRLAAPHQTNVEIAFLKHRSCGKFSLATEWLAGTPMYCLKEQGPFLPTSPRHRSGLG